MVFTLTLQFVKSHAISFVLYNWTTSDTKNENKARRKKNEYKQNRVKIIARINPNPSKHIIRRDNRFTNVDWSKKKEKS